MKPPHSNRHGGSGHGPSNRAPGRSFGGPQQRSPGGPPHGQASHGQASQGQPSQGQPSQARTGDPARNFNGGQHRPQGGSPHGQQPHGRSGVPGRSFGAPQQRSQDGQPQGQRDGRPRDDRPRDDRPRYDGPRPNGPRPDGPLPERQRLNAPRPEGQRGNGQPYQARPRQDDHASRTVQSRSQDRPQHSPADAPRGAVWLYGLHAVAAALANPARRLRRLVLTEDAEATLVTRLPPPWSLQPERVDRSRLDHLLGRDIAHQGVALLADPLAPPILQHVLERPGPIIVLDQVTDPRNVGAILRSAAAFAAAAVITQDRNAPEETGALAKAASGALETMPLLRAVNIARTLIALKAANCWTVGLDASAKAPLSGPSLAGRRVALVLGAEGEGLRRLTRETCDELAGLAMPGGMESLNVSAAGAVALYELTRPA